MKRTMRAKKQQEQTVAQLRDEVEHLTRALEEAKEQGM
jgi:hypothetical protein